MVELIIFEDGEGTPKKVSCLHHRSTPILVAVVISAKGTHNYRKIASVIANRSISS